MPYLRQSTIQTVRIGPFLSISDGYTEETALTLVQADCRISKDGGAFASKNDTSGATTDTDGWYSTTLNATDTNTCGELIMNIQQPANALPVWKTWMVVDAAWYDAMYGDDTLPTNVTELGGVAQSLTDLKHFADTGYDPATGKIETCKVNDDMVGTNNAALASVLGTPAGASIAVDIADVPTVTEFNARTLPTASYFDFSTDLVTLAAVTHTGAVIPTTTTVTDLTTTASAEPTAVPAANASLKDKIGWLFMLARNRVTQTASQKKVHADDTTTVRGTSTVSDDGTTFDRGEFS